MLASLLCCVAVVLIVAVGVRVTRRIDDLPHA
jgi:hypothetical protein